MNYKLLRYSFILLIISIFFITGCTNDNQNFNEGKDTTINTNDIVDETEDIEYYNGNEMINKFINVFNRLFTDNMITSDMISVYHHHGSDHKDQVQFYIMEKQITLTNEYSDKMSVYIDNIKSKDDDVVKKLTLMFTKVFDNTLSEEDFEIYWNKQKESSGIKEYDNIEYQSSQTLSTGVIEYIKITGNLK